MNTPDRKYRFDFLFYSLLLMLATYPYFPDTTTGAALGGMTALLVLGAGVYALRAQTKSRILAGALALVAGGSEIYSLFAHVRGNVWVEAAFTAYYFVLTVAVLVEFFRLRALNMDAILAAVSVYMLLGIAFGSLYDLVQTIEPRSFQWNVAVPPELDASLGFRELLFFSFMTLTAVGYGDISPIMMHAQSLAILEGVAGVLYVAVLVGGVVNAYLQNPARKKTTEV